MNSPTHMKHDFYACQEFLETLKPGDLIQLKETAQDFEFFVHPISCLDKIPGFGSIPIPRNRPLLFLGVIPSKRKPCFYSETSIACFLLGSEKVTFGGDLQYFEKVK